MEASFRSDGLTGCATGGDRFAAATQTLEDLQLLGEAEHAKLLTEFALLSDSAAQEGHECAEQSTCYRFLFVSKIPFLGLGKCLI
jgi:hypothetical protein